MAVQLVYGDMIGVKPVPSSVNILIQSVVLAWKESTYNCVLSFVTPGRVCVHLEMKYEPVHNIRVSASMGDLFRFGNSCSVVL